ncbi:MAG TPA: N-acyl homoserine lactonase family protein [Aggregatilineaceae bacterium]|nr:N-acyl homoserine lactonase family protein [Aggregatilineaceae bacterium]
MISAPSRLYLLQLGTAQIPLPNGTLDMVLGCYLVQTDDGQNILIDSGLPADHADQPGTTGETNVIDQLQQLGLSPADIDIVICTHLDIDHIGHHAAFAHTELIVQREEYEAAFSGHSRFAATRAVWDHPALHYRLVDGDTELLPGLTLIKTSGHTPGHQSILVRLPHTGSVLLASDAVMFQRLFTPDAPAWPMHDNAEQTRASTHKLLALVEREHIALAIFSHDGQQWQTLKKAPAYYD